MQVAIESQAFAANRRGLCDQRGGTGTTSGETWADIGADTRAASD